MKKESGVTLFELIAALLIVGILFSFTVPLALSIYQKNQIERVENEIKNAVHYARNRALLQETPLILAPLANTHDWSEGMILFVDNKEHQYTQKDQLIQQWSWRNHGLHLSWHGFLSSQYLLFSSELKHAACSGHFLIESGAGKSSKLIVNRFGRINKDYTVYSNTVPVTKQMI